MGKAIMTEPELAELLGVTVRVLRARVRDGQVPEPLIDSQKNRRWSRAVIERWLESATEPAPVGM